MMIFPILVLTSAIIANCNVIPFRFNPAETDEYYPSLNFSDSFDWKLLRAFSPQNKNVLLSPISLKIALALLYEGASAGTEVEFKKVMGFGNKDAVRDQYSYILELLQPSPGSEYLLNIGTSIFLDPSFQVKPKYADLAKTSFKASIISTNFSNPEAASSTINSWIEDLTHGKLKKLVNKSDIKKNIMLLANGLFFKGTWLHQFPKNHSYDAEFHNPFTQVTNRMISLNTRFMTVVGQFFYRESAELNSKIIRLPYKGGSYAMYIILPNSLGGLKDLIQKISLTKISQLLFSLENSLVEVHIPKFKFSFQANLAEPLSDFGFKEIFQNTASFTGIATGNSSVLRQLFVSDIIQKSEIEVDEEGSVAFSATDINIGNKFGESKNVFKATHPFLFFIENNDGNVLFIGTVTNPLEEEQISVPPRLGGTNGPLINKADVQPLSNNQNVIQETSGSSFESDESFVSLPPDREELIYRFNLFDLELLNVFVDSPSNVLISPASIKATLAMLLEGAKGNSAIEISEALRVPDLNQKEIRVILMELINNLNENNNGTFLENRNALFVSNKCKVLNTYRTTIEQYYRGSVKSVNFNNVNEVVNTMNKWVSEATRGLITEAITAQSLSAETTLLAINTLYFKGKWKTRFNRRHTGTKCFYAFRGCVPTFFMHVSDNFNYSYISNLRTHAIELPYEGKFSMLILLPNEDSTIKSVSRDIGHFKLADILERLNLTDIILEIPKFSIEFSTDLTEYLKTLKVRDIFTSKANLTGIVQNENLLINSIMHKTKIDVDEEGTVAAASTSAVIVPLMRSTTVIVNRPFIFCIYHRETRNIIFEGIYQTPTVT